MFSSPASVVSDRQTKPLESGQAPKEPQVGVGHSGYAKVKPFEPRNLIQAREPGTGDRQPIEVKLAQPRQAPQFRQAGVVRYLGATTVLKKSSPSSLRSHRGRGRLA